MFSFSHIYRSSSLRAILRNTLDPTNVSDQRRISLRVYVVQTPHPSEFCPNFEAEFRNVVTCSCTFTLQPIISLSCLHSLSYSFAQQIKDCEMDAHLDHFRYLVAAFYNFRIFFLNECIFDIRALKPDPRVNEKMVPKFQIRNPYPFGFGFFFQAVESLFSSGLEVNSLTSFLHDVDTILEVSSQPLRRQCCGKGTT